MNGQGSMRQPNKPRQTAECFGKKAHPKASIADVGRCIYCETGQVNDVEFRTNGDSTYRDRYCCQGARTKEQAKASVTAVAWNPHSFTI